MHAHPGGTSDRAYTGDVGRRVRKHSPARGFAVRKLAIFQTKTGLSATREPMAANRGALHACATLSLPAGSPRRRHRLPLTRKNDFMAEYAFFLLTAARRPVYAAPSISGKLVVLQERLGAMGAWTEDVG